MYSQFCPFTQTVWETPLLTIKRFYQKSQVCFYCS